MLKELARRQVGLADAQQEAFGIAVEGGNLIWFLMHEASLAQTLLGLGLVLLLDPVKTLI